MNNWLIAGIGNPIRQDDLIGIKIAEKLKEKYPFLNIKIIETLNIDFIFEIEGFKNLIIIDAVEYPGIKPGEIVQLEIDSREYNFKTSYIHGVNLIRLIRFGEIAKLNIPKNIIILGIGIKKVDEFSMELTDEMKNRVAEIFKKIENFIIKKLELKEAVK